MTVRLAFAVAAFLEPEILVIDEVLAVGDAEFQKKAIGKMQDISREGGRTVLFVSHNMAAVKSLCTRGIVLGNGGVVFEGNIDDAIDEYLKNSNQQAHRKWEVDNCPKSNFIKLKEVKVVDVDNRITLNHFITNEIKVEFTYEILKENELFTHGFNLFNNQGLHILSSHDKDSDTLINPLSVGIYKKTIIIPGKLLTEGSYSCSFAIMRYCPFFVEFHEENVVGFNVIEIKSDKTMRGNYAGRIPGVIRPLLNWKKYE